MTYIDSQISTGVDQLINLVYREKRVSIEKASKELGLAQKVIEEWSHILEDEGIIRLEYQLTSAYLVWAGEAIKEPERMGDMRQQRDSLLTELEGLSNKVSGLIDESKSSEKKLSAIMKDMSAISAGVGKAVDALDATKKEGAAASKEAKEMIAQLESMSSDISSKMNEYERTLKTAEDSVKGDAKAAAALYESSKSQHADIEKQLRAVESQKKQVDKLYSELQQTEQQLRSRVDQYEQLKNGTIASGLGSAREELEGIKQMYSSLNDTLEKRLDEMREALKTLNEFSNDIESLEGRIGEDVIAQRYSEIKKMMDMLSELNDEEIRLDKKLKLLSNELRSLKIEVSPADSKQVSEKIDDAKSKIKETKREVTMLEQKRKELIDLMGRMKENKKG